MRRRRDEPALSLSQTPPQPVLSAQTPPSRPRVTPPATCQVHAEEARLQMVSEMNKKLGANISRSELAALRTQVESPTANERLITTSLTRNSLLII